MINFQANPEDLRKIMAVTVRAASLMNFSMYGNSRLDVSMDLTACHVNACELDLDGLLAASDGDLVHDVGGIMAHLNRRTGKLEDYFMPRYAKVFHAA